MKKAEQIARPIQKNYHALELQYNDLIKRYVPQQPLILATQQATEHLPSPILGRKQWRKLNRKKQAEIKVQNQAVPLSENLIKVPMQGHASLQMRRHNYMKMPLHKVKQQIINRARACNIPTRDINTIIASFHDPKLDGCLRTFNHAIQELHDIKGTEGIIEQILTELRKRNVQQAKGALYELHAALKLQEEGHVLIELSRQVKNMPKKREYDVITSKGVFECKNIYFKKAMSISREEAEKSGCIHRLLQQVDHGPEYAQLQGLPYIVLFKAPLPYELAWLRDEMIANGAQVIDNFH